MERYNESEIKIVEQVIRSGELSRFFQSFRGGRFIQSFEQDFSNYIGSNFAISCSNGTVALELALAAMGVKRGDEVITTPLSFIATGTAILRVGATPVFVDVEKETLNIDPDKIEEAISPKTKVILPVSLNGYPAKMREIMDIASENSNRHDIFVLEDAAQALGAETNGQKVGTFGHMATFSFQESKTITTLGEGGMVITDDPTFSEQVLNIRNHGNIYGTMNNVACTNARMTEAQAAFGLMQLRKLDDFNSIQIKNAEYFLTHLKSPFRSVYRFPVPKWNGIQPTYYLMPVIAEGLNRDKFLESAKQQGLSKGIPGQNIGFYKKLIYESKIFQRYKVRRAVCPNAEWAKQNVLLFDIHRWSKTVNDMKNSLLQLENLTKD